jgi:hypothetical protein
LYLQHQGLLPVVQELQRRGWLSKRWQTRKGHFRGGRPFTKSHLHRLLTNVVYVGQIKYKDEVHPGEHPAIVDRQVWQQVQDCLRRNGHAKRPALRQRQGALLQGLLVCRPCGCAMTPTHADRAGSRRYRYYVCTNALQRGRQVCPSKSLGAAALEQFVTEQIQTLAQDRSPSAGKHPALAAFADRAAWAALPAAEQARRLRAVLQRVDYDGTNGNVSITVRPAGPETATKDVASEVKEPNS